jgi:exodeoxyribonuclease VII large subunit
MGNFLILQRRQLERQQNRLLLRTPLARVHRDQQHLDELNYRVGTALSHTIEINRTRLTGLEMRLNSLNPQAILKRGYSIVTQLDGRLVHSVKQVQPDDNLQVRVSDGEFEVRVHESGKIEK